MKAAVLSIGTELTRGELTNTNASWLAERLTLLGCDVVEQVTVADDPDAIVDAIRRLRDRVGVLLSTGGLGPTTDDRTAVAVARAAGVDVVRHEPSLEAIRRRFEAAGREMSATNEKQADFPAGAEPLPNPVGTAPGFALTFGDCRAFFLPGVPAEMKRLFDDHVHPDLGPRVERRSHQVTLRTFGLPESAIGERLEGIEERFGRVTLGYRASFPEIEVKVLAMEDSEAAAEELAHRAAAAVREQLGSVVFGEGDDHYPVVVGHVLRDRGLTIAVAESCTGGLVGALLTDVAGSSDYLLFDAVTYSNAAKTEILGVSGEVLRAYGAVSGETAVAMADGARRRVDADLAVSITGVAGPGGGTEEKPVGTVWIGLARRDRDPTAQLHRLSGDRLRIRQRAAYLALETLVTAARAH